MDWENLDNVTINIYNLFSELLNNTENQLLNNINNANISINNRYDNRLHLSNSSLSILSNTSNDLNNDINNSSMSLNENLSPNNRRIRIGQRSVLEDMLGVFPY